MYESTFPARKIPHKAYHDGFFLCPHKQNSLREGHKKQPLFYITLFF